MAAVWGKTEVKARGRGLVEFFIPHWSSEILGAPENSSSPFVQLVLDGQLVREADVEEYLHRALAWIANQTLEREQSVRPISSYFWRWLEAKRQWSSLKIDAQQLWGTCQDLLLRAHLIMAVELV